MSSLDGIVKKHEGDVVSAYEVRRVLDLEKTSTAFRYLRRYARAHVIYNETKNKMSDYMSLNTILMRSTFKIEGRNSGGTAFIIGQPLENSTDRARYVLVTAAHVLEEMSGSHATFFLRKKLNEHFEKFAYSVEIRRSREPLWVKHPDVDVAAMYLSLPEETDIQLATTNNMGDDEALREYEIVPGDEVMCLGYPLGAEANEAGFSILRSGKIAS